MIKALLIRKCCKFSPHQDTFCLHVSLIPTDKAILPTAFLYSSSSEVAFNFWTVFNSATSWVTLLLFFLTLHPRSFFKSTSAKKTTTALDLLVQNPQTFNLIPGMHWSSTKTMLSILKETAWDLSYKMRHIVLGIWS